jgi:hypothetical protein
MYSRSFTTFGMISFSTKYFISYGTPGSEIKTVFSFSSTSLALPLIVKHGAFGGTRAWSLLICGTFIETFYNFGNLSQNFLVLN